MKTYEGYPTEEQIDYVCKDLAECLKNLYGLDRNYVWDMIHFLRRLLISVETHETVYMSLHDDEEES